MEHIPSLLGSEPGDGWYTVPPQYAAPNPRGSIPAHEDRDPQAPSSKSLQLSLPRLFLRLNASLGTAVPAQPSTTLLWAPCLTQKKA